MTERSSDVLSVHDVSDKEGGASEEMGRIANPTLPQETSDSRAADRFSVHEQRRDALHSESKSFSERAKRREVPGAVTSESESLSDDDSPCVQALDNDLLREGLRGELPNVGELREDDPINERAKQTLASLDGKKKIRKRIGFERHPRGQRKYMSDASAAVFTRLAVDLLENPSVPEMNAIERPDGDYGAAVHALPPPVASEDGITTRRTPTPGEGVDALSAASVQCHSTMRTERIAGVELEDDASLTSLRPGSLEEFIGQEEVKEKLRIYITAARNREEPLDHVLLHGPPGLGKTTLAQIIAAEMGVNVRISSGPAIEKAGDLAAILTNLRPHDVFFIDEIHRLRRNVEEIMYPAMEEYKIDIILGEGPNAQSLRIDLPPFTLVGATTRAGLISAPMRDRFEVSFRLGFYDREPLTRIVVRSGKLLGIEVSDEGAAELAGRARGTPRIANRLLRRARDYAEVKGEGRIDLEIARRSLDMLRIDDVGLDELDRMVLETLIEKFAGGPVGLETLAAALSEEKDTIADVVEPFLLQGGFIQRTPQGRVATQRAYTHLGKARDDGLF